MRQLRRMLLYVLLVSMLVACGTPPSSNSLTPTSEDMTNPPAETTDTPVVAESPVSAEPTSPPPGDPQASVLTLLHNNDGESNLLPDANAVTSDGLPDSVVLPVGGIAAFKTLTEQHIAEARAAGNSVINVYAGDAFLASAALLCSLEQPDAPVYDALAQSAIPYTAHILGNHEFDFTPDFLNRFMEGFAVDGALQQPFLSANLDFSAEPALSGRVAADGLIVETVSDGKVIGQAMVARDPETGQRFGIVAATTWLLPTISSPRDVLVTTANLTETAELVQSQIDRLYDEQGVNQIIFVSHLQNLSNDRALIERLRRVDLAVGGGGDELLASPELDPATQLLPGESAEVVDTYPITITDADGRNVYLVTTSGNYRYLGRLDVEFDPEGEVTRVIAEQSYPRRVIPASDEASSLGLTDTVTPAADLESNVVAPLQECLSAFANQQVARSNIVFDTSRSAARTRESNTGNLVTDAFLYLYEQYAGENGLPTAMDTVIAVQNGGGIRQGAGDQVPVAGPGNAITRQNTLDLLAFLTNELTAIQDVTPADVKAIFERSAAGLPEADGGFLQVSGVNVSYDITQPAGNRVVAVTLANGTPVVADGAVVEGAPNVIIVTNSFTAGGGDDYQTLADNPNQTALRDSGGVKFSYEQALVEYLQTFPAEEGLPTIPADDPRYQPAGNGRITIVQ